MARSSQVERVHRINVAHQLLRDEMAFAEVAEVLSERFAVGKRQAYRYLREACQASAPLDSPEPKDVFHRQAPGHFDRAASQSSSSARAITEQLCLPSLRTRTRKTEPAATWPQPLKRSLRSSLRAIQTGCAETNLHVPIASWFHQRMGSLNQ
jgi:predicted DNA-binding transcriptional regulator YafY